MSEQFNFATAIVAFNKMYKLPVANTPHLDETVLGVGVIERLKSFKKILAEECNEIDAIIAKVGYTTCDPSEINAIPPSDLEILTDLADLLGDIQVYCASEMAKFGLPLHQVLEIIMSSNMSKLGADGQPIYDERGKVQKGPNYWKPEPAIEILLSRHQKKLSTPMNTEARADKGGADARSS